MLSVSINHCPRNSRAQLFFNGIDIGDYVRRLNLKIYHQFVKCWAWLKRMGYSGKSNQFLINSSKHSIMLLSFTLLTVFYSN